MERCRSAGWIVALAFAAAAFGDDAQNTTDAQIRDWLTNDECHWPDFRRAPELRLCPKEHGVGEGWRVTRPRGHSEQFDGWTFMSTRNRMWLELLITPDSQCSTGSANSFPSWCLAHDGTQEMHFNVKGWLPVHFLDDEDGSRTNGVVRLVYDKSVSQKQLGDVWLTAFLDRFNVSDGGRGLDCEVLSDRFYAITIHGYPTVQTSDSTWFIGLHQEMRGEDGFFEPVDCHRL